jgi:hypothetical protein
MEADMQTKTYKVLREHIGDEGKLYSPQGEFNTREALPNDVAHLIPLTLEEIAEEPAAAPEEKPKASKPAPENKAAAAPEAKDA